MFEISPNFSFLKVSDLAELGTLAEKYYQSDPNTSLIKCRQFAEVCAKYVSAKVGIYEEVRNEKLIYIINKLRNKKAIKDGIYYLFNEIRNLANSEVHLPPKHSTTINTDNEKINSNKALKCVKKIHKLAVWFHKRYYLDPKIPFKEPIYIVPPSKDNLPPVITGKNGDSDEQSKWKLLLIWVQKISKSSLIGGGVAILVLTVLFIKSLPYLTKTKLQETELTIGTLWKLEDLQSLIEHIENNSVPSNYFDFLKGKEIKVLANGDRSLPYTEAEKRIDSREWDIAFTTSPIISIFAQDQGYTHLAGMFPDTTHYQSGFFVKPNSPIQSLNDINANTRVALGGFNSASSFYMPVYDIYGKTITANVGHRGDDIVDLVKKGEVDVGGAAIGDSVRKDDPNLGFIHVSRDIPGAGVYASPNLSKNDYENIKKLMLNAPPKVQKEANYGAKPEPDYTEFRKIMARVEEILVCTDFSKNPVTLACTGDIQTIEGKINGVSIEGDNFILKVSGNGQIYDVLTPAKVTIDIFGSDKLTDIQGKSIIVRTNEIKGNNIKINQATQLKLK